jgi:hypothetical protein
VEAREMVSGNHNSLQECRSAGAEATDIAMYTRTKNRAYVKHNTLLILYAIQTMYGEI